MRKKIFLFLIFTAAAAAAPPLPAFIQAGKLSCGAKMYSPTQLQVWCFKDLTMKVVAVNCLVDVSVSGFFFLDTSDATQNVFLAWMFIIDQAITPPKVNWQAVVTTAHVSGPILTGVLQ